MQTASNRLISHETAKPPFIQRLLAALGLSVILTGSAWGLSRGWQWLPSVWPGPVAVSGPEDLLTPLIAMLALAVATWLWAATTASVLSALPGVTGSLGRAVARRVAPPLVRRAVAALLTGTAFVSGVPLASADWVPSMSATSIPTAHSARSGAIAARTAAEPAADLTVERAPLRTAAFRASAPRVRRGPSPGLRPSRPGLTTATEVVVLRGDTLWSLAAAHLPAGATDAEIAHAWPAWFAANADVIGDDPDLLLPGQVLRVPTGGTR